MITLVSFGYKFGAPPDTVHVHDCRKLRNPHNEPGLRESDGRDPAVKTFVERSKGFAAIYETAKAEAKGFGQITIAFGCYGGRHRSVALAELLHEDLKRAGHDVRVRHRELEKAEA